MCGYGQMQPFHPRASSPPPRNTLPFDQYRCGMIRGVGGPPYIPLRGDQQPDKEDLADAVDKGKICDSKDMYFVPHDTIPDSSFWSDEKPLQYGTAGDQGKTKRAREAFAVNVLHTYNVSEDEWHVSEVRVNSTVIQVALEKVLEGYPGLTQHELKTFPSPFRPFFHRWQSLISLIQDADPSSEAGNHLQLLKSVLEPLLEKSFDAAREVEKTGHVSFANLPLVYIPGTAVMRHESHAVGIFRSCHLIRPMCRPVYYAIVVDVVDWDGRRCGLLAQEWQVEDFSGLHALTALEVSPLEGLPAEYEIREKVVRRGRTFEKLRGHFFMAFTDEHLERTNERMVIDARAYHKYEAAFPNYASLSEIGQLTWAQSMNRYSPSVPITPGAPIKVDLSPMTDEQCLLAVSTVKCFNIQKKRWEMLDVTRIHEIAWAQHAFDNLVLDQEEKNLLLAVVDRDQFNQSKPFDDFISGKGQGMIMLLCGPPGVGKTLTAETVSEHLRRPLYKLGAGDLGINAKLVEECLERALQLCAHFGAVLLIDEADVFMEARTSNNLQRNELVSVFLRLLEYYNGIMILTTNRMRSIDPAFESRIDITLSFNSLSDADRKQVWRNFLATLDAKDFDIDDADLVKLAQWKFNGRQIKSAIKTARILAAKKREPLNIRHLDIVLKLRDKALGMMSGGVEAGNFVENTRSRMESSE
ncbi:P-loop containing nucleoside triphosphate hydrolase protein [Cucurbitaria berberidis CBS 394.84]|uniref:P-loop containing nucleoside triphosphate hydrolase protein n=1 Tax=Cucurbitaria berberidis CBS 394.84 TaxID=1168544 RepID=A0A9P4GIV3_9PLEO|nr:P-loop containing nucleoside triphosphate hydrolase protein [Cucurbitaria berberidis CBS 394.84]KAF1846405.1 P-loop containing nucleoside triphosphate hydrolase protein [Cucurbitaria berberidis CBS 394.84]